MEQTSKLSIVVDTRTAEGQLKAFRQSLREVQKYGNDMDKSLSKIGSKTQFAGIISSLKAAQSNLQAFSGTAKNSASALNEFNAVAKSLQTSTKSISNNFNSAQTAMTKFANGSKAISTNLQGANTGIVQTQTNLMKIIGSFNFASNASGKLSVSAKTLKADIAALNAALATGSGALGRFGQASNAAGAASNNARARNTELANSYRLVNTGLQSNSQYLQQANRSMAANSSAAVAAKLNQDKLAISSSKVATANSRAAEAAARAQIAVANLAAASSRADAELSGAAAAASRAAAANSNAAAAATRAESATSSLAAANSRAAAASSGAAAAASRAAGANSSAAAAASRAAAAVSGEAAARERALAAASRTAAAAANAAAAQDRAAAAAVRLALAEARAAAEADRLAGGLGRANGQAHGFMGTLNSLQGLLMGSMFSIATLGVIKTADEMQNLNSQIKLATKSEGEYLLIRQKVSEIADRNYSAIAATTNLYQNSARALANLGKSQQDVLVFTDAVSLAMRTGGRSTQEQASAILQLSQSMSSNILAGDEFRSLAENAPILLELVAKRMGVLPGQLKALAADGKITGEIIYDALSENIGMLEKMAKQMPLTMSQAFTVAKNRYKSYVNDMMNETGGMSGKIASMIEGMSANFDTLAKVAIAGVTLAFANMALSIGTASTAMAIFNTIASMNPLILIATGFIAINSAIFGVNDVLSISGIMLGDFFDGMGTMLADAEKWWKDFGGTVDDTMDGTVKSVAEANDKNSKNFLGFYEKTEKGFAGVVQGLGTGLGAMGLVITTLLETIGRTVYDMIISLENVGRAAHNAGSWVREQLGFESNRVEYLEYQSLNPIANYQDKVSTLVEGTANYAKSLNKRALPKAKPGEYDPNYVAPLRSPFFKGGFSSVLQGGQGVLANQPVGLPGVLRNNQASRLPMDVEKLRQKNLMDEMNALEESEKLRKKLEKEREAAARKANKGLTNRLVGISGDTGVGNAHLHIQYRDKSRPVSPADLARFKANGKALTDYKMTSGYGKRNTGIKGASTNHKGTDFGIPKNTPITTSVAVKNIKTWKDGKGGGYVSTITFEDGVVIDLLHQMPSVMGIEKGASTGNKQIDSMVAKAEGNIAREAAKAEKERIRAAEEAQREQERIDKLRLKLIKEYGDKELQLNIENDERIAEIKDAGFNGAKQAELIEKSKQRMNQELAVHKKGLDDRVSELVKFQKTERDLLRKQYDDEVFEIVSHPELSRPENKALLTQALENARLLNEYRLSLYEQSLDKEKSAMYAFQKTERQILADGWEDKLADAMLMYDELRDYRIEAIKAEGERDIDLFDLNQDKKLLELKKYTMTEMEYIRAKYELERKLAGFSNEGPEVKAAQDADAKQAFEEAQRQVRQKAGSDYQDVVNKIYGLSSEDADLTKAWQAGNEALKAALDAGIIEHETYYERLADLDQNYINNKQAIIVGGYQSAFGLAASITKAFGGEQSGMYRALFAVEKAFAFSRIFLENKVALAKAYASAPFPYNLAAVGKTLMTSGVLTAAIDTFTPKGFKQGGYTGNMGASQVAGVVHGQEYVFDAQSTKRIGVDNLNAMRSGKAPQGGGDVNITVNVDAQGNGSMSGDQSNAVGKQIAVGTKALVMDILRKEKRQGGLLYG